MTTLIEEILLSTDYADYRDFSEVVVEDGDKLVEKWGDGLD